MIINPITQNHEGFEELVKKQKANAFYWPFKQSQEPVQPIEEKPEQPNPMDAGLQPPPNPMDSKSPPPPKPSSGSMKNVASRMLAEGLDLPESTINKPMPSGKDPLSKSIGGNQSKLLAKRKIDETNKPSSLGGMKV